MAAIFSPLPNNTRAKIEAIPYGSSKICKSIQKDMAESCAKKYIYHLKTVSRESAKPIIETLLYKYTECGLQH